MLATLLLFDVRGWSAAVRFPRFSEYPARSRFDGAIAEPQLRTPKQKMFRTMIRNAVKRGPNFAGTYAIAQWGCGTSCLSIAVINVQTGEVSDGPFTTLEYDGAVKYPNGSYSLANDFKPLEYHLSSRMLVVRGCPDDYYYQNCALRFYAWDGRGFQLVQTFPGIRTKAP
jgi:hypothetical protein